MKITELYAYICTEDGGGEGVPAVRVGDMVLPLMGADATRMASLRDAAQDAANQTGRPIRLAVFRQMEVIEEIKPVGK